MTTKKHTATVGLDKNAVLAAGGHAAYFVKHEGQPFKRAALTSGERVIVEAAIGRKRFKMKECFYNAQRIIMDDESGEIVYVEGYRRSSHGLHAWAAINGKVIDVTVLPDGALAGVDITPSLLAAIKPSRYFGLFPVGQRYRGVAFTRAVWSSPAFRFGDSILDNWQAGWPAENGVLDAFRTATKGRK